MSAPGRVVVHGGGTGGIKRWLDELGQLSTLSAAQKRRLWRTWVIFDKDAGNLDACEPSDGAITIMDLCEDVILLEAALDDDLDVAREAEVAPLQQLRKGTVRTKAFLLFLAGQPQDDAAAMRRADFLGQSGQPGYLFRGAGIRPGDPGNAILADPSELRLLRKSLASEGFSPYSAETLALADEFTIPLMALAALPDEEAFVRERREALLRKEAELITGLGLRIRADSTDGSDEEMEGVELTGD